MATPRKVNATPLGVETYSVPTTAIANMCKKAFLNSGLIVKNMTTPVSLKFV